MSKRIDFDIQCEHELTLSPIFNHLHYNNRWLNNTAFNMMFTELVPQLKPNATSQDTIVLPNEPMTIEKVVNENIIERSETNIDFDDFDNSNVTYQALILRCTELCRTVQNDQTQCRSVMSGIIEWTKKLRMKDSFRTVF